MIIENFIKDGRMVFYANEDGQCIGAVAVKKLNKRDYELCKLVVVEKARGLGLEKKLIQKCIDFVKEQKGCNIYLQCFNKLEIALNMYNSMGFVDCIAPKGMLLLVRPEIIMKKGLK